MPVLIFSTASDEEDPASGRTPLMLVFLLCLYYVFPARVVYHFEHTWKRTIVPSFNSGLIIFLSPYDQEKVAGKESRTSSTQQAVALSNSKRLLSKLVYVNK